MHEKFKTSKRESNQEYTDYIQSFDDAVEHNREIEPLLGKSSQVCLKHNLIKKNIAKNCPSDKKRVSCYWRFTIESLFFSGVAESFDCPESFPANP